MSERFKKRGILVTGAASGLGAAAARGFAAEGGRVALADLDFDGAAAVAHSIRAAGGEAIAIAADVSDYAQCGAMVRRVLDAFGALHIAFNNAGMPSRICAEFEDVTLDEWRRLIDVNLTGVFHCIKAEAPALKASGGGAIVNTASVASLVAAPGMAAYVASKHGVGGLTKAAALDLIRHNIRVNAICPGFVDTPMLAPALTTPAAREHIEAQPPIGRIASADEIARAALWLASDEASYLVGALVSADGGVTAQ